MLRCSRESGGYSSTVLRQVGRPWQDLSSSSIQQLQSAAAAAAAAAEAAAAAAQQCSLSSSSATAAHEKLTELWLRKPALCSIIRRYRQSLSRAPQAAFPSLCVRLCCARCPCPFLRCYHTSLCVGALRDSLLVIFGRTAWRVLVVCFLKKRAPVLHTLARRFPLQWEPVAAVECAREHLDIVARGRGPVGKHVARWDR